MLSGAKVDPLLLGGEKVDQDRLQSHRLENGRHELISPTVTAAAAPMGEDDRTDRTTATNYGSDGSAVAEMYPEILRGCHRCPLLAVEGRGDDHRVTD